MVVVLVDYIVINIQVYLYFFIFLLFFFFFFFFLIIIDYFPSFIVPHAFPFNRFCFNYLTFPRFLFLNSYFLFNNALLLRLLLFLLVILTFPNKELVFIEIIKNVGLHSRINVLLHKRHHHKRVHKHHIHHHHLISIHIHISIILLVFLVMDFIIQGQVHTLFF